MDRLLVAVVVRRINQGEMLDVDILQLDRRNTVQHNALISLLHKTCQLFQIGIGVLHGQPVLPDRLVNATSNCAARGQRRFTLLERMRLRVTIADVAGRAFDMNGFSPRYISIEHKIGPVDFAAYPGGTRRDLDAKSMIAREFGLKAVWPLPSGI